MNRFDPEYILMESVTTYNNRFPSKRDYHSAARGTSYPTVAMLIDKYGSFNNFVESFLKTYISVHECPLPDYLLGCLAYRAKVVRDRRRFHVRFITKDIEQIRVLQSFAQHMQVYPSNKHKPTLYVRLYDTYLVTGLERFYNGYKYFIPSIDFVRGYIETHGHFRVEAPGRYRLTLTGPLVPLCRDFLVGVGARNTRLYSVGSSYRWNIQSGSLRKLRDTLYPDGCVCNERVRMMMYKA
ncbi:hypothetical protein [Alicyclobacillus macrosporangiidus]|uniref:Uncharacterized protein n=1 Tax=Alicyclobacillus macrosporangiidus TaxID=392015 RepID=A0A1I7KE36_9BACL|nr:hypothetical protein [Alicyclobacillus macrosporangiidus]SFU95698.1 hypothetical protein SAMN05421543_11567 [Alicyclobacillus macrosporangiidus]